uniref:HOOK domain-containing protein n=1 Tax=Panagrellus redivivus TaxID=6233 RepID=A0A7E4VDQ2_PANRE
MSSSTPDVPDGAPSRLELVDLVQMQDAIIDELSTKLESLMTESDGDNEETASASLLMEMRDKLFESVTIMEELQRKNSTLSSQLQKLQDNSNTTPSMTCIELHSLLEKERDYASGLRKRLIELETREQQQLARIDDLQFQLSESQQAVHQANNESQNKINQLLAELSERQRRFDEITASAASMETRCAHLEENCNIRVNLAEEHCDQLRGEVSRLMKSKNFLTERVVDLTDELARCRMKLSETPLSVLTTPDEYQIIVDEQKRVIDSLADENTTLKEQLNTLLNR